MYRVIDDSHLNSEKGYEEYSVGRAAEVPWTGVTGKPEAFPPQSHNHEGVYLSINGGTLLGNLHVVGNITATGDVTGFLK